MRKAGRPARRDPAVNPGRRRVTDRDLLRTAGQGAVLDPTAIRLGPGVTQEVEAGGSIGGTEHGAAADLTEATPDRTAEAAPEAPMIAIEGQVDPTRTTVTTAEAGAEVPTTTDPEATTGAPGVGDRTARTAAATGVTVAEGAIAKEAKSHVFSVLNIIRPLPVPLAHSPPMWRHPCAHYWAQLGGAGCLGDLYL